MAIRLSTGLRNHICVDGSIRSAVNGFVLKIYSGTVPSSPDSAVSNDGGLLCTISLNDSGTGLGFEEEATNGVLLKDTTEAWQGTVDTSGTATYFRLCAPSDDEAASSTALRVQGVVDTVNGDMLLSSTSLVAEAIQRISYFSLTVPAV